MLKTSTGIKIGVGLRVEAGAGNVKNGRLRKPFVKQGPAHARDPLFRLLMLLESYFKTNYMILF